MHTPNCLKSYQTTQLENYLQLQLTLLTLVRRLHGWGLSSIGVINVKSIIGQNASARDLNLVFFSPQTVISTGQIVLVPRSGGGFTYGSVLEQRPTTCKIDPVCTHDVAYRLLISVYLQVMFPVIVFLCPQKESLQLEKTFQEQVWVSFQLMNKRLLIDTPQ